jgi:hypothetical protein
LCEGTRKRTLWRSVCSAVDTHLQHQSVSASRLGTSRTWSFKGSGLVGDPVTV